MKLTLLDDPIEHTVRLPTLAKNIQDGFRDLKVYKSLDQWQKCLEAVQKSEEHHIALCEHLYRMKKDMA